MIWMTQLVDEIELQRRRWKTYKHW